MKAHATIKVCTLTVRGSPSEQNKLHPCFKLCKSICFEWGQFLKNWGEAPLKASYILGTLENPRFIAVCHIRILQVTTITCKFQNLPFSKTRGTPKDDAVFESLAINSGFYHHIPIPKYRHNFYQQKCCLWIAVSCTAELQQTTSQLYNSYREWCLLQQSWIKAAGHINTLFMLNQDNVDKN